MFSPILPSSIIFYSCPTIVNPNLPFSMSSILSTIVNPVLPSHQSFHSYQPILNPILPSSNLSTHIQSHPLLFKGYSSGPSHFLEINIKLAEKNKYATHSVQRSLEICENKEKPSVYEDFWQKSSTSDVEKFHQWRNLCNLPVWDSSSSGGETWKNFSVEANLCFADSQFDGIYLFIKWLISWSKTIHVWTSCWSRYWLTMVQSSQLESSSCGQFCLCKDKWISYGVPSSWKAIDACVLVLNQYVTVECNQSIFMIKTRNYTFLSWFGCCFRKCKDWLTKTLQFTGWFKMAVLKKWSDWSPCRAKRSC